MSDTVDSKGLDELHNIWQKEMYDKYPVIFGDNDKPMTATCMCWGISVGNGWHKIIEELCDNLVDIMAKFNVKVVADQVKEKFGTLRFYWHAEFQEDTCKEDGNKFYDMIDKVVNEAEDKSGHTCEVCGEEGTQNNKGWISTLCKTHSNGF